MIGSYDYMMNLERWNKKVFDDILAADNKTNKEDKDYKDPYESEIVYDEMERSGRI